MGIACSIISIMRMQIAIIYYTCVRVGMLSIYMYLALVFGAPCTIKISQNGPLRLYYRLKPQSQSGVTGEMCGMHAQSQRLFYAGTYIYSYIQ